jgi:hypothetical protein
MGNRAIDFVENLIPNRGKDLDIIALGFQESVYETDKMFEGRHHLEWVLTEALRGEHEDFKLVP